MNSLTVVVLSDPSSGTEEALGRMFNALAVAYDAKTRGTPVSILFQGAGTRWPERLADVKHPAHALYQAVQDRIMGVSCACSEVFGAKDSASSAGFDLIRENKVPGTSGLPSLVGRLAEGGTVLTF